MKTFQGWACPNLCVNAVSFKLIVPYAGFEVRSLTGGGQVSVPTIVFIVSALASVVPNSVQIAGASLTVVALLMNNVHLRRGAKRALDLS